MRRYIVLSVLLLWGYGTAVAQSFSVGVSPTSLLDPITPSIDFSLEYQINQKWSTEVFYGWDANVSLFNWVPEPGARHHEYRLLLKYFFKDTKYPKFSRYLGIDFFGNTLSYERVSDWYTVESGQDLYYEQASIVRSNFGSRLIVGNKFKLSDSFYLEIMSGIGVKQLKNEYTDVIVSPQDVYDYHEFFTTRFDRQAGTHWRLAFSIGIQMEYQLF